MDLDKVPMDRIIEKVTQQPAPVEDTGKQPEPSVPSDTPAVGQVENSTPSTPEQTPKEEKKLEWDGDVNKLPPDLQEWAKTVQRHVTKKAMSQAELIRAGEEFQQVKNSEEFKQFLAFKQNPQQAQQPQSQQVSTAAGITPEEWEAAQLDSTGKTFQYLMQREVQKQVNAVAASYGQTIQQVQQQQQVAQWQTALADYAEIHPDIVEFHQAGLMKPLIEDEFKSGRHSTYQSVIDAAYEKASAIKEQVKAEALKAAQGRVAEKKGAVINTGIQTGEATSFTVDDKRNVIEQAALFAMEGKKIKVKSKR